MAKINFTSLLQDQVEILKEANKDLEVEISLLKAKIKNFSSVMMEVVGEQNNEIIKLKAAVEPIRKVWGKYIANQSYGIVGADFAEAVKQCMKILEEEK